MKNFNGKLTIDNQERHFEYNDGILTINLSISEIGEYLFSNAKPLKWDVLNGMINGTTKHVIFLIYQVGYGSSFKQGDYAKLNILVKSFAVFHIDASFDNLKFIIENDKFAKWLQLLPIHNVDINQNNEIKDNIVISSESQSQNINFDYNKLHCSIRPYCRCNYSTYYFHSHPCLILKIKEKFDIKIVTDLFTVLKELLEFVFYRKNVELGGITIYQEINSDKGVYDNEIGQFNVPSFTESNMESPDLNKLNDTGYLPWAILNKYFQNIVDLLKESNINLRNIPENKRDKWIISLDSISKDASSFESEFNLLYPKYITKMVSEIDRNNLRVEIKAILDKAGDPSKTKYNYWLGLIDQPSLKEKCKHALNDFHQILSTIIDKYFPNNSIEEISKYFIEVRNPTAHDSLNVKITNENVNASRCMKILIYAMQLKRAGFSNDDIKNSICYVFEI